jgi:hypothetical protein
MARISEISGPETSGPSPWTHSMSVARRRRPAIRRFAPIRRFEFFQLVGDCHQGALRRLVLLAQRAADVLAVDDDLAQHGHHGSWRVVGGWGPGPQAANQLIRAHGSQAPGGPVGEDVESEASRNHLLVEVRRGLLGGGQNVAGGVLDWPAFAPGGSSPLVGDRSAQVSAIWARSEWM